MSVPAMCIDKPVRALRRLGKAAPGAKRPVVYQLPVIEDEAAAEWYKIGTGPNCDIVLEEPSFPTESDCDIAKLHCFLLCTYEAVTIRRFRNHEVRINDVLMAEGHAQLSPTNVIRIGDVELAACGEDILQNHAITAVHLGGTLAIATRQYGDATAAAEALNAEPRTMRRWLKKKQFWPAVVVLLLLGVSGALYLADRRASDERAPSTLPAAAPVLPGPRAERAVEAVEPTEPGPEREKVTTPVEPARSALDAVEATQESDAVDMASKPAHKSRRKKVRMESPVNSLELAPEANTREDDIPSGSDEPRFPGGSSGDLRRHINGTSEDTEGEERQ